MQEFEKFYSKVWKQGNSHIITIPGNIVKYGGYKEGVELVVMIKKKGG